MKKSHLKPILSLLGFLLLCNGSATAQQEFLDTDGDGCPDAEEMKIVTADPNDDLEIVDHVFPDDDYDLDGFTNEQEFQWGTDAVNPASCPPSICFSRRATQIMEPAPSSSAGNILPVHIQLSQPLTNEVRLRVLVEDESARNGTDYQCPSDQAVIFDPSVTNISLKIVIMPDEEHESSERFSIRFKVISGNATPTLQEHTVVIEDNVDPNDDDSLPDWWEVKFFGDASTYGDDDDPDGDGVNNRDEFKTGRHPLRGAVPDTNDTLKLRVITPVLK